MYSNFYTKYTVLHILTKKKAKQPSLILCTGKNEAIPAQYCTLFHNQKTQLTGVQVSAFSSLSVFIFLTGSSFSNEPGPVLKTRRETGKKKKAQLFLYLRVHYHLRRTLCSIHNSYNSHIFKNIGSYSILHHLWRKAKWTNRNIPHRAKANVLFWKQTPNTCLKLQLTLEKTLHSLESMIKQ